MASLDVVLYGDKVGELHPGQGMEYHFNYVPGAQHMLSCSLPICEEPFSYSATKAFFGGLLPEHLRRETYARRLKLETEDDYRLLEAIGGDCAGAVQIEAGSPIPARDDIVYTAEELPRFCDDVRAGILVKSENRLSLTGAQLKEAVTLGEDNSVRIPRDGRPSTHILKVPPQPGTGTGYESIVYNEYFCLQLAQRVSKAMTRCFSVCESSLLPFRYFKSGEVDHVLCVKRFDRNVKDSGGFDRIHQEDFCQALGRLNKYETHGGPDFADLAAVCDDFAATPGLERLKLYYAAVFNMVIGNCDSHGRNFSLHIPLSGHISLTPLYDLVSTTAYPELDRTMAMSVASKFELDVMDKDSLAVLAKSLGLSPSIAGRQASELCEVICSVVDDARASVDADNRIVDTVVAQVQQRARMLR